MTLEPLTIQHQTWSRTTRFIISDPHASVQLEIYSRPSIDHHKVKAYIWALWVDADYRRQGRATRLLKKAEEIARSEGEKAVWLEWEAADTDEEILQWYQRQGYKVVAFTPNVKSLLKKKLTPKRKQTKETANLSL